MNGDKLPLNLNPVFSGQWTVDRLRICYKQYNVIRALNLPELAGTYDQFQKKF